MLYSHGKKVGDPKRGSNLRSRSEKPPTVVINPGDLLKTISLLQVLADVLLYLLC